MNELLQGYELFRLVTECVCLNATFETTDNGWRVKYKGGEYNSHHFDIDTFRSGYAWLQNEWRIQKK